MKAAPVVLTRAAVLAFVDERGEVSIAQVVGKFKTTPKAARRELEQLVEQGSVEACGEQTEHGFTRFRLAGRSLVFGIFDSETRDWYIGRFWDTEREAGYELASLLWPYAMGSEWHVRLAVKPCGAAKQTKAAA